MVGAILTSWTVVTLKALGWQACKSSSAITERTIFTDTDHLRVGAAGQHGPDRGPT